MREKKRLFYPGKRRVKETLPQLIRPKLEQKQKFLPGFSYSYHVLVLVHLLNSVFLHTSENVRYHSRSKYTEKKSKDEQKEKKERKGIIIA